MGNMDGGTEWSMGAENDWWKLMVLFRTSTSSRDLGTVEYLLLLEESPWIAMLAFPISSANDRFDGGTLELFIC